jgi:hypothetical protein
VDVTPPEDNAGPAPSTSTTYGQAQGSAVLEGSAVPAAESGMSVSAGTVGGPSTVSGSDAPSMAPITYTNANDLTWIVDGSRVEMLSNLPLDELLKVAAGLVLSHDD